MLAKMNNFSCWVTETDPHRLKTRYEQLLIDSGFNVVNYCEKHFTPQGFTGLWLLAESHFAVHTFPERGKTYIELTSCVKVPFDNFIRAHTYETTESDKETIKFTIPLAPISKKNSQRILINRKTGKPFIMPSEQYKKYEDVVTAFYVPAEEYIDYPVNVKCLFYMPTRRKCDLTNLLEAIDDVLVNAGLLADDNYSVVAAHDGSRIYYDKKNPRTEVYITAFAG